MFSKIKSLLRKSDEHLLRSSGRVGPAGNSRVRCALRTARLGDDVRNALLTALLHESREALEADDRFAHNVDHPDVPEHIYFEGALDTRTAAADAEPIMSLHPRFGADVEKPLAPLALRQFAEAFRVLNKDWLDEALADTPYGEHDQIFDL